MTSQRARVVGLVLAAGEGRRLGRPKALVEGADGRPWVARAVDVLRGGGVDEVSVVVGADAEAVRAAIPASARTVEAADWREGMGASLRAGLAFVSGTKPLADAVLVLLVDTPGVGPEVVRLMIDHAAPDSLVRATYDGSPGHPVLLGRDHWQGVIATAAGDRGARTYLNEHGAVDVECGAIADGADIDTPERLQAWRRANEST
jgi:molybdenum cofactor cytidylyltransferase/nicotine blue oxidoreductase